MRPSVQGALSAFAEPFLSCHKASNAQVRTLNHIISCKTSALGGHVDICPECGKITYHFNSCRDRHCPLCQSYKQFKWVEDQASYMLDIGYYHMVFTLPSELNPLFYSNQKEAYSLLFKCSWETLKTFSSDKKYLGAEVGATAILHTWGRTLQYHPHIHMIVTAGGLKNNTTWRKCGKNFFAPVKAMSKVFKAKIVKGLRNLLKKDKLVLGDSDLKAIDELLNQAYQKDWVVYAKAPFKDAGCLLKYLGQYTSRVAISDSRIKAIDSESVTFSYRDVRDNKLKNMTLEGAEFVRRFLMHIVPSGFTRIRHYGLLSSRGKRERMSLCKRLTNTRSRINITNTSASQAVEYRHSPKLCPACNCELITFEIKAGLLRC